MPLKMFSVRDVKVSCYKRPFFDDSAIDAVRQLQIAVNDKNMQLSFYPEDFELYELGEFEPITGKISLLDHPKFVVAAISLKKLVEQSPLRDGETSPRSEAKRPSK